MTLTYHLMPGVETKLRVTSALCDVQGEYCTSASTIPVRVLYQYEYYYRSLVRISTSASLRFTHCVAGNDMAKG